MGPQVAEQEQQLLRCRVCRPLPAGPDTAPTWHRVPAEPAAVSRHPCHDRQRRATLTGKNARLRVDRSDDVGTYRTATWERPSARRPLRSLIGNGESGRPPCQCQPEFVPLLQQREPLASEALAKDLPETMPWLATRNTVLPHPSDPLSCGNVVRERVIGRELNRPRDHGKQEVRGSSPLSSTPGQRPSSS